MIVLLSLQTARPVFVSYYLKDRARAKAGRTGESCLARDQSESWGQDGGGSSRHLRVLDEEPRGGKGSCGRPWSLWGGRQWSRGTAPVLLPRWTHPAAPGAQSWCQLEEQRARVDTTGLRCPGRPGSCSLGTSDSCFCHGMPSSPSGLERSPARVDITGQGPVCPQWHWMISLPSLKDICSTGLWGGGSQGASNSTPRDSLPDAVQAGGSSQGQTRARGEDAQSSLHLPLA